MVAVSVLVRTIGRQAALKDALDSLLAQTLKDFEVLLIEDGPPTLDTFLSSYAGLNIRYEALGTNKGRSVTGNRALSLAQGEYCLFLDEDDALHPDHLQLLLEAARGAGCAIAYSWAQERAVERAPDGTILRHGFYKHIRRERFSLLHLVAGNYLPINAVLFRHTFFAQAGGFDEDIDCLEDWLLWLRYAAIEPDWLCVPQPTAIYHVPLNLRVRRRAFRQWHAKVHERMLLIKAAWPMEILNRDLHRHFGGSIFLRKLYYYLTSYL